MEHAVIRFCRGIAVGAILAVFFLTLTGTVEMALRIVRGYFSQ